MKRANQAWLLLPDDGKVQHLFAVIMDLRGDYAQAWRAVAAAEEHGLYPAERF